MLETEGYDAVVFDLDGTLVRLSVNWDAVADDLRALLRGRGADPAGGDAWELLAVAETAGAGDAAHRRIAAHERAGARCSRRLALADALPEVDVPVGVCSLNAERAVEIALDCQELRTDVETVVGRDTVSERKPHPAPLQRAAEDLGAAPAATLFVGDSRSDETTARRTGAGFAYVGEGPTDLGR